MICQHLHGIVAETLQASRRPCAAFPIQRHVNGQLEDVFGDNWPLELYNEVYNSTWFACWYQQKRNLYDWTAADTRPLKVQRVVAAYTTVAVCVVLVNHMAELGALASLAEQPDAWDSFLNEIVNPVFSLFILREEDFADDPLCDEGCPRELRRSEAYRASQAERLPVIPPSAEFAARTEDSAYAHMSHMLSVLGIFDSIEGVTFGGICGQVGDLFAAWCNRSTHPQALPSACSVCAKHYTRARAGYSPIPRPSAALPGSRRARDGRRRTTLRDPPAAQVGPP